MDIKDLQKILEKMEEDRKTCHKEISNSIKSIDKSLIKQGADLKYHIRRTDLLEAEVKKVREDTQPIHDHVTKVEFFFKVIKWIGVPVILTGLGYSIKIIAGS